MGPGGSTLSSCLEMNKTIWKENNSKQTKMRTIEWSSKEKLEISFFGVGMYCHMANKDKSQWDRNRIRELFVHVQPSIKVLSPAKHTQTVKNRHTQADTRTNTWISQYFHTALSILIQILRRAETLRTRFPLFIAWNTFTSAASGEALSKWNLSLLPIALTLHCSTS